MNIPILSKRLADRDRRTENAAVAKTLVAVDQSLIETGAIEKSFLSGNAATMMSGKGGGGGKAPGTSWSNQGGTSSRLIARVTQNLSEGFNRAPEELELSLAEQGMSWGPPFPPGRPLDPFFGYRRPARTWDYTVGENVQLTPRWNRVSFPTIKAIYEAYDVAQICVRHLINDVRSLDYNWEPIPGTKEDVSKDIEEAIAFFESPDKRQPFRTWLAEWLQDVLRYDAGALYIRRNNAGDPIALEVVSGETIIPLIDFYGRRPEDENDDNLNPEGLFGGEIVPAYVQIIEGLPWDWLAADDLIYQPWNPLPESQYGLAPLEAVLLSANTDVRFQWHFLQFFTEGTMPAGFMEAPPDMSDPAQIASWQETWDAVMQGDQSKLRQIRWVPNGAKFTEAKPSSNKFDAEFPLYLMRRTCASFGVTPNDLGFTENVNRATGDTQVDVQFRVGTSPLLRYCEDVINLFTREYLKLRCRLRFDDGKETEDRVATATADGIYLDHGVIGIDEVRADLGKPIDKSKPSPRYINNSRSGPIPLLALESMAGGVDPDTYGVADSQELIDTPYIPPPGVIPAAGTEELKGASEASARAANAMRAGTSPEGLEPEAGEQEGEEEGAGEEAPIAKMIEEIDQLLDGFGRKGMASIAPDNTGGPGVKGPATTIRGGTDGITVPTGVQGEDLLDDEDEEDEDAIKTAQQALSLRRWRDNSRNRIRKGKGPKFFVDPLLPMDLRDEVWKQLQHARTREDIDRAFKELGKKAAAGERPAFHSQADAIVAHYSPQIAAELGKLFSAEKIKTAFDAASKAKGSATKSAMTWADKAACWNKSQSEMSIVERSYMEKAAEPNPAARAAIEALEGAAASPTALEKVLTSLYGDSFLQGSHDAAVASGASVVGSLAGTVDVLPDSYWDAWKPGHGDAAARVADGGLKDLLDKRDITIKGLTDTTIERIGNQIAEALARGDSYESAAKLIRDAVESAPRADTIANTEYARAMTESSLATYREAGIEQLIWEAEEDACVECEENADAGPLAIDDEWPNGDVPVHPNCRCAIAPVVDLSTESEPTTEDNA